MNRLLISAILSFLLAAGLSAHADELPKLAVMTIEDSSGDLSGKLIDDLTDYLRTQIARRGRFVVIDKSRQADALKRLVGEAKKESYRECYDDSCQIPLGRALSADTVLRVKLTRIGSAYQLSGEVVDLATEAVDAGAAASVEIAANPRAGREDRLLAGVRTLARQIAGEMPGGQGETITLGGGGDYGVVAEGGSGTGAGDGIVTFESNPAGATVEVNGRKLPQTTPVQEFLALGKQRVKVMGPEGYETFDQEVTLEAGQTVRIRLRPVTGSAVIRPRDPAGTLLTGVAVFIDGEEVALAPVRINGILAGTRTFRFVAPGMREIEESIRIQSGKTRDIDVNFVPALGKLRVDNVAIRDSSLVKEGLSAEVWVNDEKRGNTPLELALPPGEYRVEIRHPLGRPQSHRVRLRDSEVSVINPELVANGSDAWRAFARSEKTAERTGTFVYTSYFSSSPGRLLSFSAEDVDRAETTAKFTRLVQVLSIGVVYEGEFFGIKAWDPVIDLSLFELPGLEDSQIGLAPFTSPGVVMTLRPAPLFPLKVEVDGEVHFAFSSDDAEQQFKALTLTGGAHLAFEMGHRLVLGFPPVEVAGGARYFLARGIVEDVLDGDDLVTKESQIMYGGRLNFALFMGKDSGLFLGGGYYTGSDGAWCAIWNLDYRGGWKKK